MTTAFGTRLQAALAAHGPLCVGIDPHARLLETWGLRNDAAGLRDFGLRVVDAAAGRVAAVKPQVAFYERLGAAGYGALEDVLRAARTAGLLVIADAKRGDIGSTMTGYAEAWLTPGSPLEADALTISPFLGPDSLRDTLIAAKRDGKGVFVLAATSNQDAIVVQGARTADGAATAGETVSRRVVREAGWIGGAAPASLGSVGVVIGATVDRALFGLDDDTLGGIPILAPGFGAQGATPADLPRVFGALGGQVLANESRSILGHGPAEIVAVIDDHNAQYRRALDE